MPRYRYDETWHRLLEWTKGQAVSERLATQILISEGFTGVDPSHPLGGKDGGKDAIAMRGGKKFVMAAYFPRGRKTFKKISDKFKADFKGVARHGATGFVFVTNQELRVGQRKTLAKLAKGAEIQLYHLERLTAILDSPPMKDIRRQFLDIESDNVASISLGGLGGAAPGAGGGGGGAIGQGARAGDGGKGGSHYVLNSGGLSVEEMTSMIDKDVHPAPGSGGGGAPAIGPGAIAGDGGDGGDSASGIFKVDAGDIVSIQVGEAGKPPTLPGQHGQDGQESVVSIQSPDGTLKRTIRVKGGPGAKAGKIPLGVHTISQADIDGGFNIVALMPVDAVELRDGLLFVLGGGWGYVPVTALPTDTTWEIVCTASWNDLAATCVRGLQLCLLDPHGVEASCVLLELPPEAVAATNLHWITQIGAPLTEEGRWQLQVKSGKFLLSSLAIDVKLAQQS